MSLDLKNVSYRSPAFPEKSVEYVIIYEVYDSEGKKLETNNKLFKCPDEAKKDANEFINQRRLSLKGNTKLCFKGAEEGGGGILFTQEINPEDIEFVVMIEILYFNNLIEMYFSNTLKEIQSYKEENSALRKIIEGLSEAFSEMG